MFQHLMLLDSSSPVSIVTVPQCLEHPICVLKVIGSTLIGYSSFFSLSHAFDKKILSKQTKNLELPAAGQERIAPPHPQTFREEHTGLGERQKSSLHMYILSLSSHFQIQKLDVELSSGTVGFLAQYVVK